MALELHKLSDFCWEIPPQGGMRVPGIIYADEKLLKDIRTDQSLQQVANVAHLPGIVKYSLAMPDIHWGYGFPIGGVAAMDPDAGGVISPGGVGYDINCGVRILRTGLVLDDAKERIREIVAELYRTIPTGVGAAGAIPKLSRDELRQLLVKGAQWMVARGYGTQDDVQHTEEYGCLTAADPDLVSDRAIQRGLPQVGTLGSGNHFCEVSVVDRVFLPEIADRLGVAEGSLVVLIHTGSRGFGYQVCDDFLKVMAQAMRKYGIALPDPQLACAPLDSSEGRDYLAAMSCAANYAWANRQCITHLVRQAFQRSLGRSPGDLGMDLIYDVCHNIAKFEEHKVNGQRKRVCMHRKGATRAFPPGHQQLPEAYRELGQPVLVPGDMGRSSYVCIGTEEAMERTFGSTCHGAGRVMSRHQAVREAKGRDPVKEMEKMGVVVMAPGRRGLAEEMPYAYKDVGDVVDVMDRAGISRKVFRVRPIGVIKG